MSFNRLTIQSLQAARQRVAYNGLAGLGTTRLDTSGDRPSVDYVKAGDVIRVYIADAGGFYFGGGAAIASDFTNRLRAAFNVVVAPAGTGGGVFTNTQAWVVDVQPRSDYAKLSDAVSVVLHEAQAAGLNVNAGQSYGQFVSKVETTGGTPPVTIEDPNKKPGTPSKSLDDFLKELTSSPTTLAVILGATVLLVVAMKNR